MRTQARGHADSTGVVPTRSRRSIPTAAIVLALGGLLGAMPAQAFEFGEGEFQGSLDTTISHGLTFRVGKRDPLLAGKTNSNDGNLNYGRGVVSNTSKFTTDLDIGTGDFGAFVRASGFIDFENQNGERERTPLSEDAKERVGRNLELLDAYVTGTFDVGDTIVDARIGRHVLNWGESTFIPNGINAINPFDVSKLRLPGSELREALLPVGLASLSVAPTDTLSMEGFYQFEWEETEIDAVGSYFSVTDYVGPGAREAVLQQIADCLVEGVGDDCRTTEGDWNSGFGALTPAINADIAGLAGLGLMVPLLEDPDRDFATVLRGPDRVPEDSGQWGLALRYLAEDLNDTEFGFYGHELSQPTAHRRRTDQQPAGAPGRTGGSQRGHGTGFRHPVRDRSRHHPGGSRDGQAGRRGRTDRSRSRRGSHPAGPHGAIGPGGRGRVGKRNRRSSRD